MLWEQNLFLYFKYLLKPFSQISLTLYLTTGTHSPFDAAAEIPQFNMDLNSKRHTSTDFMLIREEKSPFKILNNKNHKLINIFDIGK